MKMDGVIFLENKEKVYVGALIADVHVGALDAHELYFQLNEVFIKTIKELPVLDFIVICGDLIDKKISMNSQHATILLNFISDIKDIIKSKENPVKLRILKGTESHDNRQLEVLHSVLQGIDYKIINEVEEEYLFEDFKVLYIPEEYMEDMDEYYSPYIKDIVEYPTYDMIFGHGMVKEASFHAKAQESEITMPKAPVFDTKQLIANCKGPIFFGHIHTRQTIRKHFYYVGSFTRWSFGEEEDKGFSIVAYSPETANYKIDFVKNKLAKEFVTIEIDVDSNIFNEEDIVKQVQYLKDMIVSLTNDYIRLKINIPEDYREPQLFTNTVPTVFSKYKNVKLKIINNTKLRKEKQTEEVVNLLLDRYGFLFEKNISHEEKIVKYIKEKYSKDISIESVREYLYKKVNS